MIEAGTPSSRINTLMEHVHECGWINISDVDSLVRDYKSFFVDGPGRERMKSFKRSRGDSVHQVYLDLFPEIPTRLKKIVKMSLVFFAGQAAVERGFSVNKECVVVNLEEKSLVAQRRMCSLVEHAGGLSNVSINDDILRYMRQARQRRERDLEEKKKIKDVQADLLSQKRKATAALKDLEEEKKKARLNAERKMEELEAEEKRLLLIARQ